MVFLKSTTKRRRKKKQKLNNFLIVIKPAGEWASILSHLCKYWRKRYLSFFLVVSIHLSIANRVESTHYYYSNIWLLFIYNHSKNCSLSIWEKKIEEINFFVRSILLHCHHHHHHIHRNNNNDCVVFYFFCSHIN